MKTFLSGPVNDLIIQKLKENKGVIVFSVLKYFELAVSAFTTFFVAKKIGPVELGYSIPVLLYITYSSYLSLGLNQALLKNRSRFTNDFQIKEFITANLQYLLFACFINILICITVIDKPYSLFTGLISCGLLIRGFFSSYFRSIYRVGVLNINNTLFSIMLLVLVFLYVNTWYQYVLFWSISIWVCVFLYFISDYKYLLIIIKNIFGRISKEQLIFNLSEGIKLAITGFITTFLLTADRVIINHKDYPIEVKGTYQLADYFGVSFYMFVTTIFFYFYPKWIERIRNEMLFRKKMIEYVGNSMYIVPLFAIFFFFIAKAAEIFVFSEYKGLEYMVVCSVLLKSYVIINSIFSTYFVGIDQEKEYIKLTIPICVIFACLGVFFYLKQNINILVIASTFAILLFLEVFRRLKYIKNKYMLWDQK